MAGRFIVLTGVTRGLGRALVTRFAVLGATVLGCGRSPTRIADLRRLYPKDHDFETVDVIDDEAVHRWAQRLLKDHRPPDLLINNAAVVNDPAALWDVPAVEFDRLIDINIKGVVNVIRHFVPAMVRVGKGVIVNMSSGWGRGASPGVAPYCASKFAIEGLTLALAQELPKGMAAIPLNPGIIDTDMLRQCWADSASSYPKADDWALKAAPFILALGPKHNGQPLSLG